MTVRDLSHQELKALAFVDERELVRDLVALVSVPSVSGSDAESEVQHLLVDHVAGLLVAAGADRAHQRAIAVTAFLFGITMHLGAEELDDEQVDGDLTLLSGVPRAN